MRNFTLIFCLAASLSFVAIDSLAQTSYDVDVVNFDFMPSQVTINVGDTVYWFNTDGFHSIDGTLGTNPDNPEPFGNDAGTGWTYFHVFDVPGTYNYICGVHPNMTGIVIVEDIQTSIQEIESDLLNHVFPIPATEYVVLELADNVLAKHPNIRVKLFDQLGREHSSEAFGQTDRLRIDVSNLHSGVYFYQLLSGEEALHTGKMVVQ